MPSPPRVVALAACLPGLVVCRGPSQVGKDIGEAVCDTTTVALVVRVDEIDPAACGDPPRNLTATVSVYREDTYEEVDARGGVHDGEQVELLVAPGTYRVAAATEDWFLDDPDTADGAPDDCRCSDAVRDVPVACGVPATEVVFQIVCEAITWG